MFCGKNFLKFAFALALVQINTLAAEANQPNSPLPVRYQGKSVYIEFFELLQKYKPLNLGTGTPEATPPESVKSALSQVALSDDYSLSQYSPDSGHPRLLNAVAKFYSKHLNRTLNPDNEIVITVGAAEALFVTFQSHTQPGDEWIIVEPYFEPYAPIIKASHGVPRFIALKPTKTEGVTSTADWTFDREEMASLFNKKTKGILLNSPNNPLGKMFTYEELSFIAELAKKWNTIVIFDEVYEYLTFDNNEHIRMATLPGMYERTISIGSAGKVFGATGYRIGWAYGNSKLIGNLKGVHSLIVKAAPTPLQEVVAVALEKECEEYGQHNSYLETARREAEEKRNYLSEMLQNLGAMPIVPEGGYFLVANVSTLRYGSEKNDGDLFDLSEWLMKNVKVTGMPLGGFYSESHRPLGSDGIRFTIVKDGKSLRKAEQILKKFKA